MKRLGRRRHSLCSSLYKTEKFDGELISSEEGEVWWGGPERIAKSRPLSRYGGYASYLS